MVVKSDSTTDADCRFERPWAATALIKSFLVSAFTSPQPEPILEPPRYPPLAPGRGAPSLGRTLTEKTGMAAGLEIVPHRDRPRPIRERPRAHEVVRRPRGPTSRRAVFAPRDTRHLDREALSPHLLGQPVGVARILEATELDPVVSVRFRRLFSRRASIGGASACDWECFWSLLRDWCRHGARGRNGHYSRRCELFGSGRRVLGWRRRWPRWKRRFGRSARPCLDGWLHRGRRRL